MFQDISIDELITLKNTEELTVIDVRSPSEYKDATIPGSINIPFLMMKKEQRSGQFISRLDNRQPKTEDLKLCLLNYRVLLRSSEK